MEFRDGTNVEDGGQPDDGDTGNETGSDHSSDLYHSAYVCPFGIFDEGMQCRGS